MYDNIIEKLGERPLYITKFYCKIVVECFEMAIGLSNENYTTTTITVNIYNNLNLDRFLVMLFNKLNPPCFCKYDKNESFVISQAKLF